MSSISTRIAQGSDDAHKTYSGYFTNSDYLTWGGRGVDPTPYTIMQLRFQDITIPKGATINSAKITVRTPSWTNAYSVLTKIYGIDEDDTATFSSDGSGRTRTSASADWDIAFPTTNTNYESPDLASLIQEIVNRAGWASGNAMGFLIDDDGSPDVYSPGHNFIAYDNDPTYAPLLEIDYTGPAPTDVQKSLKYTIIASPSAITKMLRYRVIDPELTPVPFFGLKIAKYSHNVLNTSDPNNLKFSSDYNTLKYYLNGFKTLHVDEAVSTQYRDIAYVEHNLGYYPDVEVFGKDDTMPYFQPLGHWQAGSGAYRQFYYYVTDMRLYVVATGWTGIITGDTYDVDFYYKIYKNNLNL